MTRMERLVDTEELKTEQLFRSIDRGQVGIMDFDPLSDILMLMIKPRLTETVVHYIDKNVALLYEPDTLEVVGFQIEGFERSFMPQHEAVGNIWRLSDAGVELANVRDLLLRIELTRLAMARELRRISQDLLDDRGVPVLA